MLRRSIGKQLRYLWRNLRSIAAMAHEGLLSTLSPKRYRQLHVIQKLYRQQLWMYSHRCQRIANRIVSISQPHIRLIVRGKAGRPVELAIPRGLATGILFLNNGRVSESTVQKASHCVWQIHYHIVFPLKYRKVLLEDDVVAILTEVTQGLAERYDMEFERLGCERNHIHLLCSAHPKIAPWQIVRVFKSITGRELFRRKPALKKELWGGQFWSDGYYVGTVGEGGNWRVVERYGQKQGTPREELRPLALF